MLGKLLKYDFKAMIRQFALLWPAAIVLAFIGRLTFFPEGNMDKVGGWFGTVVVVALVGVIIAMLIVSFVFIVQRFYKGILGDEGYLMHTLPVKTWQLITSKLICALVVNVLSTVVALLALFVFLPIPWSDFDLGKIFQTAAATLGTSDFNMLLIELLILTIISSLVGTLVMYLAMSIGQLFNKKRVLLSVCFYFAITVAFSQILSMCEIPFVSTTLGASSSINHAVLIVGSIVYGLLGVAAFIATNLLLKKKLNLE